MYIIQGKKWKITFFGPTYLILAYKQAGAELCQAQTSMTYKLAFIYTEATY